jgi:hypothetical protein
MDLKKRTRWGLERGNVDIYDRPTVKRPGGYSTTLSSSYEIGGKEVLLPHVADLKEGTYGTSKSKNPSIISGKQSRDIYAKTGQNLGKFRTPQQADQYAKVMHNMQVRSDLKKGKK